jgi:chromosome segregation ATPase
MSDPFEPTPQPAPEPIAPFTPFSPAGPDPEPSDAPAAGDTPDEITTKTKLREFEDDKLGANTPRIDGAIERGHGSHFKTRLSDQDRAYHAALENLLSAEQKVADTSAALAVAQAAQDVAEKRVEAAEATATAADAEAQAALDADVARAQAKPAAPALRTDGPTLEQWQAAGNTAPYPPAGYAAKETAVASHV